MKTLILQKIFWHMQRVRHEYIESDDIAVYLKGLRAFRKALDIIEDNVCWLLNDDSFELLIRYKLLLL